MTDGCRYPCEVQIAAVGVVGWRAKALCAKGGGDVLFYCRFTWYPGVSRAMVARRLIQQHELGTNHPERIKGWYTLAGGGAGFMIIEADHPHEVSAILEPYMDIMGWDVHAIAETPYDETIEQMKKELTLG